jgi:hypothetical protein
MDAYLDAFAACGRGERDTAPLLEYYAPPVLLTSDDVCLLLRDENEFVAWAQNQADSMQAVGFDRIEVLDRAVEPLNRTSALVRGAFVRRRRDSTEISRLTATYVVVSRPGGVRIAALAIHSPE